MMVKDWMVNLSIFFPLLFLFTLNLILLLVFLCKKRDTVKLKLPQQNSEPHTDKAITVIPNLLGFNIDRF